MYHVRARENVNRLDVLYGRRHVTVVAASKYRVTSKSTAMLYYPTRAQSSDETDWYLDEDRSGTNFTDLSEPFR